MTDLIWINPDTISPEHCEASWLPVRGWRYLHAVHLLRLAQE